MRRTDRLFHIIQILRSSRSPVTGRALADELEISLRTLYRDMAELMAQRVPITGEAGTGYVLDDGYDMPPLMLTADELEAAALGAAWVATQADPALVRSARDLVAKLSAAVPPELRPMILDAGLKPIATTPAPDERFDGVILRRAIRDHTKLQLTYKDGSDKPTTRIIWPLLIAYLNKARYIVAWCETREDYRHFRTDRVHSMEVQPDKYPGRRKALIKGWEDAMASKH